MISGDIFFLKKETGETEMKKHIGIIGGGAAGMMAAVTAARKGTKVTILERNDRIGKKYYRQETENAIWATEISRWNVTMEEMLHG